LPRSTYVLATGTEAHIVDDDELYPYSVDAKVVEIFPAPSEKVIDAVGKDLPTAQVSLLGRYAEVLFNEAHSAASDRELQAFVALALLKNDQGSSVRHIREEVILVDDRSVFEHLGLIPASELL
jgi:hypothetical protein